MFFRLKGPTWVQCGKCMQVSCSGCLRPARVSNNILAAWPKVPWFGERHEKHCLKLTSGRQNLCFSEPTNHKLLTFTHERRLLTLYDQIKANGRRTSISSYSTSVLPRFLMCDNISHIMDLRLQLWRAIVHKHDAYICISGLTSYWGSSTLISFCQPYSF